MINLIYIVTGYTSAVFSQVIELLKFYEDRNEIDQIILIVFGKTKNLSLLRKLVKFHLRKTLFYPIVLIGEYPYLIELAVLRLRETLKRIKISRDTIVHVRGEISAYIWKKAISSDLKVPLLIDIRGAIEEEIKTYFSPKNYLRLFKFIKLFKLKLLKDIHQKVFKYKENSIFYSVVSPALREYLLNKFKIQRDKIFINSCMANEKIFKFNKKMRIEFRKFLGIKNKEVVFIFISGGWSNWQQIGDIDILLKNNYKVIILGRENIGLTHPNLIVRRVDYFEVPYYLWASDIALLFREKNIVNYVASPIKFSEYLISGLPVISNGSVKLVKDIILKYRVGTIKNSLKKLGASLIKDLLMINRNYIVSIGMKYFSLSMIGSSYIEVYKSILYKVKS